MNLTISKGNMTDEPKLEQAGEHKRLIFNLALNRIKDGADFPRFIAWDKKAEIISQYCHKGSALLVTGHIRTDKYTNKDGKTVYTQDIIVDSVEFCDKKKADEPKDNPDDGWMNIPDGIDAELPFN